MSHAIILMLHNIFEIAKYIAFLCFLDMIPRNQAVHVARCFKCPDILNIHIFDIRALGCMYNSPSAVSAEVIQHHKPLFFLWFNNTK